ncbi:helicase-exonuclease AddAB subunit AddA, partial [Enterococcus faecalis]
KWAQAADTGELLLPEAERGKAKNFLDWIGMAIMRVPSVTEDYPDVSSRKLDSAAGVEVKLKVVNRADLLAGQRSDTGIEQGPPPTLEKVDVNSDINDAEQIRAILNFKYHDIEATQTTAYQSVSEIKRVFDDPDKLEMDFSAVDRDQKIRPQKRFVTDQL